jgi:hypothetical protein
VVPELEGILFGGLRIGRPMTAFSPDALKEKVSEGFALVKPLSKKETLAGLLYAQSHFHTSDAARFLTLISAVEALAERNPKSSAAITHIDKMIGMTLAVENLDKIEKEALVNGLRELRQQSIAATCRGLVRQHCGEPDAMAFAHAYKIRSKMLHNGEPPSGTDLAAEAWKLDTLVRRLVSKHVVASQQA